MKRDSPHSLEKAWDSPLRKVVKETTLAYSNPLGNGITPASKTIVNYIIIVNPSKKMSLITIYLMVIVTYNDLQLIDPAPEKTPAE